jgi:hypothetical protein
MKNRETNKGLVILMVIAIVAAGFFGYKTYSVDKQLDIPVVDHVMGHDEPETQAPKSKSSSKTSSGNRNGANGGGNGNRQRMGGPGGGF